ncbi:MAG: DNA replication and repair protein RecF, partial [Sphingomonadales bacterium]
MALDRIALSSFRNHRQTELGGTAQLNLLVGENGAGKTNVLEALSLLAPGRGLRRAALPDLPGQNGNGGFQIGASLV